MRPALGRYAQIYSAFIELNTERQLGMSVGPIPKSAIRGYIKEFGLPQWWESAISRIDSEFIHDMSKADEVA